MEIITKKIIKTYAKWGKSYRSLKNWADFRISSKSVKFCQYENSTPWFKWVSICCFLVVTQSVLPKRCNNIPAFIKCIGWLEILPNSIFLCVFSNYRNFHTDKIWPILEKSWNLPNFSMTYNFFPFLVYVLMIMDI